MTASGVMVLAAFFATAFLAALRAGFASEGGSSNSVSLITKGQFQGRSKLGGRKLAVKSIHHFVREVEVGIDILAVIVFV